MNYTNEEKDKMVKTYFKLQKSEVPVSVRTYAAHVGVKYYTFRDWYRDYKARSEYSNLSTNQYSKKRKDEVGKAMASSEDDGFSFIRITDDVNQNPSMPEEEVGNHVFDR